MNYYEHHLGDYDGATAHLTWLEDCAYRRLICLYYRMEAPIPAEIKQACRLVRAQSKQERDAVEQVLGEFFTLSDDGWHHDRCDKELAEYAETIPDREARRENDRERQRRARERRKTLFESLREHDIVPPFDTKTPDLERMLSRVTEEGASRCVTQPVTRDNTATQTPDTKHQTPKEEERESSTSAAVARSPTGSRLPADWSLPAEWGVWALQERPELDPAATAQRFADYWHGKPGKEGRKLDWLATWRNWVRNERAPNSRPFGPSPGSDRKARQLATAAVLTGASPAPKPPPETIDVHARIVAP